MQAYREYSSDAEKAKVYEHRISQAIEQNKTWHPTAEKHINRYENLHSIEKSTANGHQVNVPTGVSIIDALYSSLTATEVDLVVTPSGMGTDDQAYIATSLLSKEWETAKVPARTCKAVKDALLVGIGWVKVGYEYFEQEQDVPRPEEHIAADIAEMLKQAEGVENGPSYEDIVGNVPMTMPTTSVLADRVVVDYVPWDMVLVDPTAKQWSDVRWVAQETLMQPREVQENPLFREYVKRSKGGLRKLDDLKGDATIGKSIIGDSNVKPEDTRVTVYEVHDFETGTICTYAKGKEWLLNETANPFAINDDMEDQSSFVPLVLRTSPRRVRGISEMDVLAATLSEMDLYRSKLGTYLERMAPKYVAPARMFTAAGKNALQSQEYGAVVEIEEGFEATQVQALQPPTLMSEMYDMPGKLEQEGYDATGASELMRGMFPDRKRTATETAEVVSASAARQAEKRTQLESFYLAIAHRMLQLMQMFYDQDRVVRLVDEPGTTPWQFDPQDIVMEFSLEVALTPKEAKSWQSRRDNALAALNVLGPLSQPGADGSSPVNVLGMLRYILTEMNFPRRVIHMLLNLPEDQQQQMMAALQTQAGQAQAAQGVPNPAMVPGPLDERALAAATNSGAIPPEVLAAASGAGPLAPQATEQVSESAGLAMP